VPEALCLGAKVGPLCYHDNDLRLFVFAVSQAVPLAAGALLLSFAT
jgi:hypothetical protein